jgi:hypothetical protein
MDTIWQRLATHTVMQTALRAGVGLCLLLLLPLQPSLAAEDLFGTPDQDRAEIAALCKQQAFGQDCLCVKIYDRDLINESRKFLLLVLREQPEQASAYAIRYMHMSRSNNAFIRLLGQYAFKLIVGDASAVSLFCHFKPPIINYIARDAPPSRPTL